MWTVGCSATVVPVGEALVWGTEDKSESSLSWMFSQCPASCPSPCPVPPPPPGNRVPFNICGPFP